MSKIRNTGISSLHRALSTKAIASAKFVTMLFELWASRADAGPQFKQHFPKRRAGRRTDDRVGVFRAQLVNAQPKIKKKTFAIIVYGHVYIIWSY